MSKITNILKFKNLAWFLLIAIIFSNIRIWITEPIENRLVVGIVIVIFIVALFIMNKLVSFNGFVNDLFGNEVYQQELKDPDYNPLDEYK